VRNVRAVRRPCPEAACSRRPSGAIRENKTIRENKIMGIETTIAHRPGRLAAAAVVTAACLVTLFPLYAFAQMEDLPPRDVYIERGRSSGDSVALCVNGAAMMAPFEKDLAVQIAGRLLLTPKVVEVKTWHPTEPLDYRLPLGFDELYIEFAERCDGFMGFSLAQGYPSWLIITRPYMSTRMVLAAAEPEYHKLPDIPPSRPLGTRMLGAVDNQLILYLQSLPEKDRWKRVPYFNNKVLIDRLLDRSVAAAFVWEPALYLATGGAPAAAGIHTIPPPFELLQTEFGIGLRSNDSYLSVALGQAIDSLRADGTIDRLLIEHTLAPKPQTAAQK
jgi:polar amino acid transport system substrate-binding protein